VIILDSPSLGTLLYEGLHIPVLLKFGLFQSMKWDIAIRALTTGLATLHSR